MQQALRFHANSAAMRDRIVALVGEVATEDATQIRAPRRKGLCASLATTQHADVLIGIVLLNKSVAEPRTHGTSTVARHHRLPARTHAAGTTVARLNQTKLNVNGAIYDQV